MDIMSPRAMPPAWHIQTCATTNKKKPPFILPTARAHPTSMHMRVSLTRRARARVCNAFTVKAP